jgi:hypothetical protein
MQHNQSKLLIALAAIIALFLLFPFKSVTVPALSVKVIDEHGDPVEGAWVKEFWRDYSYESEDNAEEKFTDKDGVVMFPQRTVRRLTLLVIAKAAFNALSLWYHASFGPHGSIIAISPDGENEGFESLRPGDPEMQNVSDQPNQIEIKLKKRPEIKPREPGEPILR